MKCHTEVIYKICGNPLEYEDLMGEYYTPSIHVFPDESDPNFLNVKTVDDRSSFYFGKIDFSSNLEVMKRLGAVLIEAAERLESEK